MTFNTPAIILCRDNYLGFDSRVVIYTPHLGKIDTLARGLQKQRSKLAAHSLPGALADCFVVQGRHKKLLAGVTVAHHYCPPDLSLPKVYVIGALLRLTNALTDFEEKDEQIFTELSEALDFVYKAPDTQANLSRMALFYAWRLLGHNGYGPQLDQCLVCAQTLLDDEVLLAVRRGGVIHRSCYIQDGEPTVGLSKAACKGLKYMTSAPLSDALRLRAEQVVFSEIRQVIMAIVAERYEIDPQSRFWSAVG